MTDEKVAFAEVIEKTKPLHPPVQIIYTLPYQLYAEPDLEPEQPVAFINPSHLLSD